MEILKTSEIDKIIDRLNSDQTIIFPTETSYGLGCDATNQTAVDKIFQIKGRPENKSLLVVVANIKMAKKYLYWNDKLENLAEKFWLPPPPAPPQAGGEIIVPPVTIVGEYIPLLSRRGEGRSRPFVSQDLTLVLPLKGEEDAPLLSRRGEGRSRLLGFIRTIGLRRKFRKESTKAEKILWYHLNHRKLGGLKFRRQHGIGQYIVDFYQPDTQVIVEVDGDVHFVEDKNVQSDMDRTRWLESFGYKVMRFDNLDILKNLKGVLDKIYFNCEQLKRDPLLVSPLKGGDLASGVVSKENTIAVRVTHNIWLKELCMRFGKPIVATSANIAGAGEMYDQKELVNIFAIRTPAPDVIVDGGVLQKKIPSTVVSVVNNELKVLREGEAKII